MPGNRQTRRTALRLLGIGGTTILTGLATGDPSGDNEQEVREVNGEPVVSLRSPAGIPFERIAATRISFLKQYADLLEEGSSDPAFVYPETNRDNDIRWKFRRLGYA